MVPPLFFYQLGLVTLVCVFLALVHKYAQPIEFITFFDLTQKNVTC
jgi:hypothetical protein